MPGVEEARAVHPGRFDRLAEEMLQWAVAAAGDGAIPRMVDAFVQFSYEVNKAQARYEAEGHYEHSTFAECYEEYYSQDDFMDDYLWGVYLTNFLWAHHAEIGFFYEDRFLAKLAPGGTIRELAPGHGGWGVWALKRLPEARLEGFDISPHSIELATALASAAGVGNRATYRERNALELPLNGEALVDACVCNFLMEHLEDPDGLIRVIAAQLRPHGTAFLSGALTAAQVDHIYEFKYESELVAMCERNGLRVLETFSGAPRRTLPNAKYLPRSMAIIATRRMNDIW